MTNFKMIKQQGDGEIYSNGTQHFMVIWNYSTGSETGLHNSYNTNTAVYKWTGDSTPADELDCSPCLDWELTDGFDIDVVDSDADYRDMEWDWDDYVKKVNAFLSEIQ